MKKLFSASLVAGLSTLMLTGLVVAPVHAAEGRVKARGANGMVAAGSHNGNSYVRGHGVKTNSDGSTTTGSGAAFKTNTGAAGARGSATTYNPDGSVEHEGGFATSGARGNVNSQGGFTRNADGTSSGSRTTNATNAQNGNSYTSTTTYDSTNGVSHQSSCKDATGNAIACPTR